MELQDSVAVITGGASGIGRSLGLVLAREGARVVIADLQLEPAQQVADELVALGTEALAVACDITIETNVENLGQAVRQRFGGTNLLCNIAGVNVISKLHETSALDVEWLFSVNVFGLCHMVRHFVPQLQASAGRGEVAHMINASSGFGVAVPFMGPVSPSAYTGTKHAVVGLSDAMRKELAPDGIGVSVVCPGVVNTQTWTSTSFRQERFGGPVDGSPESKARVEAYGQDPDETAARTVAGVKRGDFFILPLDEPGSASMDKEIRARYEELLAALGPHED